MVEKWSKKWSIFTHFDGLRAKLLSNPFYRSRETQKNTENHQKRCFSVFSCQKALLSVGALVQKYKMYFSPLPEKGFLAVYSVIFSQKHQKWVISGFPYTGIFAKKQ